MYAVLSRYALPMTGYSVATGRLPPVPPKHRGPYRAGNRNRRGCSSKNCLSYFQLIFNLFHIAVIVVFCEQ